jgi:hypothetical protein
MQVYNMVCNSDTTPSITHLPMMTVLHVYMYASHDPYMYPCSYLSSTVFQGMEFTLGAVSITERLGVHVDISAHYPFVSGMDL